MLKNKNKKCFDFSDSSQTFNNYTTYNLEMNEQRVFRQYITRLLKSDIDVPRPKG